MELSELHLLLTYQCTFECDHCFVWGSPWQEGVMTLEHIRKFLYQAAETGTIQWIYFEGGEPFLYYATLLKGVQLATEMGFQVGMVTNAYWATSLEDALQCLKPFGGLVQDLSVSSDLYHYTEKLSRQAQYATRAAKSLGIPAGIITIAQPEESGCAAGSGKLPEGESAVMYRGRAAEKLATRSTHYPGAQFTACPHEDLRQPGRVHLDPLGNIHICQGIALGNLFQTTLKVICSEYSPETHPICGPLLAGGPAALARQYGCSTSETYADACHLCYTTRLKLRPRFPEILTPDQMYGVPLS